jgi:hypothetical protein
MKSRNTQFTQLVAVGALSEASEIASTELKLPQLRATDPTRDAMLRLALLSAIGLHGIAVIVCIALAT